jgi:hypothetical protein
LDLTKLYLALTYFQLQDPGRFIAYKSSDSSKQHASENTRSFAEMVGPSHSPQAVLEGGTYHLDFFTYDSPGVSGNISHWKIDVDAINLKERLSAHHVGFHVPYSSSKVTETAHGKRNVLFSQRIAGEAVSDDGAHIDVQMWESSDGPGVNRSHYYYKSHEKAEKRMLDFLQKAVAILENRPWLDSGKAAGTQALVIMVNEDKKILYASQLFEDESSVLEFSCGSLSNLMAVQGRELSGWNH